ncbi:phenoloxidase-activating factor 3-like [Euwallacea similis]|uniref:phenoloxidase-activating factor 3-like n=1 Tax=Euwallacea similis TaxID=1736056 RepID=UPI00344B67CD
MLPSRMTVFKSLLSAVLMISVGTSTVASIDIECLPLEECPFSLNVLSKSPHTKYVIDFVNSTKCGRDSQGKLKVWCARFVNCRTNDFRNGTCLPPPHCTRELSRESLSECNIPGKPPSSYICCPWSTSKKRRHIHGDDEFHDHRHDDLNFMENRLLPSSPEQKEDHHDGWWTNRLFSDEEEEPAPSPPIVNDSCKTPDNDEGACKNVYQCPRMLEALANFNTSDTTALDYLRRFKCPSKGLENKLVCCPQKSIVLPVSTSRSSSALENQVCGQQSADNKIAGGKTTSLGEFPWAALLEYNSKWGRRYGCGGSVISVRYILTAAHCVDLGVLEQNGYLQVDKIVLGEYDTRNATDCFVTQYGSECSDPLQILNVEKIIKHQSFSTSTTRNDIALIKVEKDIVYSKYVQPICLPSNSFSLQEKEHFFITGWGRTETGSTSPVKLKARVPLTDKSNCSQLGSLGEGQICVSAGLGIDSCKGDSGGPVMKISAESGDIVTTLIGIISYGFGKCGTSNSVNTYVPFYLDWIKQNSN